MIGPTAEIEECQARVKLAVCVLPALPDALKSRIEKSRQRK